MKKISLIIDTVSCFGSIANFYYARSGGYGVVKAVNKHYAAGFLQNNVLSDSKQL